MIRQERLNAYRIMWLFVFFDLPVETKKERKAATDFRKVLLKDGFSMLQFSVYNRHCASDESAQVHIRRTKAATPEKGQVSILKITDKQYSDIINIWGTKSAPLPAGPQQIEMF
jgi:CRISPR-associated protein Cas2